MGVGGNTTAAGQNPNEPKTDQAEVEGLVAGFQQQLFADLEPDDLAGRLIRARWAIDCLEVSFSRDAAALAESEMFSADDLTSTPIDWMRHNCRMQFGVAVDRLTVGEQLPVLEASGQAVLDGEIGFAHLSVLARMRARLHGPTRVHDAKSDPAPDFPEEHLLEQAKASTPGRFWHYCRRLLHALSPDGVASEQRIAAEERWLRLAPMENGSICVSGQLDSIGGAALQTALEPLARPTGEGDERCRERRYADAAVELAMLALDGGQLPHVATQRPHLQVTTTLETLRGFQGAPAADLEFAEPISSKTVQRLACDAVISRVVFGPGSVIVDVGRARRVVSSATRRALNARDRQCRWPGCERPASWSAAHHLVHWAKGGSTDLSNMVLLCHRHHWCVHEGGWKLARAEDDRLLTIPPTYDYFHRPRAPDEFVAA